MIGDQTVRISNLPVLTDDERDDAAFRAKDLGWAALVRLFYERAESEKLSYQTLGRRIKRSRSQVQRWLSSPFNLSLSSLGLLAEGLNADLTITLRPRPAPLAGKNYCHPSEAAKGVIAARTPAPLVTTATQSTTTTGGGTCTTSKEDELLVLEA